MGCSASKAGSSDFRSADFKADYRTLEKIGKGGFSEVFRCEHKKSKAVFAVKKMLVSSLSERDVVFLREEVKMLHLVNKHTDRVIRLHDFYEDESEFHMVLEYLPGGDLFDRIHNKQTYNEEEARHYVQSLLCAVKACHDLKVVHRDLKPENLLVKHDKNNLPGVKLADFGFATVAADDQSLTAGCGTMHYVAPEILRNRPYGRPVDMWSCGVIAYIMLGGYPPFYGENKKALVEKIKLGAFKFHEKTWINVSPLVKDLIRRLLVVKPENRLTADEALRHEWMKIPGRTLSFVDLSDSLAEFKKFNARRKFRAYVRTVMAVNRMRFVLNSFGLRPAVLSAAEVSGHGELDAIMRAGAARPIINIRSSGILEDDDSSPLESHSMMPPPPPLLVFDVDYDKGRIVGQNRFGNILSCTQKRTGKLFEVKIVSRHGLSIQEDTAFRNEVRVLRLLRRDKAVRPAYVDRVSQFVHFYKEHGEYCLVLEHLYGGMLFDRIHKQEAYSEFKAREIIRAILQAVKACHDNGIVHCNIKPETLRLARVDDDVSIRLVDFDLAGIVIGEVNSSRCLSQRRGTLYYIAPEILSGLLYGKPVDMWSVGVVSFILLGGYPPFFGSTKKEVIGKIKSGQYSCSSGSWKDVSSAAVDFVSQLLVVKAGSRATVDAAMSHPWMSADDEMLSCISLASTIIEFRRFNARERFRIYVHMIIAANRLRQYKKPTISTFG